MTRLPPGSPVSPRRTLGRCPTAFASGGHTERFARRQPSSRLNELLSYWAGNSEANSNIRRRPHTIWVWLPFGLRSIGVPDWAEAWRGEDMMAHTRRGQKLPDAFLLDDNDDVLWAIEFGGSYDTQRVEEFHVDCASRDLPYQIW